ncbi:hypothetical protein [Peribacillus sp. SI8-4]|uniref:hypothetical protein n=1 Tax=Peribacillus sp. SI8-4 TaxID=3048009 RepID=UPI0025570467|nr:hypothetical protein [Peribacillus sp. SI8-4]
MGKLINAGRQRRVVQAFELVEKAQKGEVIEITELTMAVSQLLNNYHNQMCSPDEKWTTREETEALHKLLRILSDGIGQLENIDQ